MFALVFSCLLIMFSCLCLYKKTEGADLSLVTEYKRTSSSFDHFGKTLWNRNILNLWGMAWVPVVNHCCFNIFEHLNWHSNHLSKRWNEISVVVNFLPDLRTIHWNVNGEMYVTGFPYCFIYSAVPSLFFHLFTSSKI